MPKKTAAVTARIPDDLRARLDAIHAKHMTGDTAVITHMLTAFCDYVEASGKVELPIKITPAKDTGNTRRAVS